MKTGIFTIRQNVEIAPRVFRMVLEGDVSDVTNCGQFVNIRLKEKYLRRPISVYDYDDSTVTIIYKVVGEGTEIMSAMTEGEQLDVMTGLGNGYDLEKSGDRPLLIGGGVGVPPMYNLCKKLVAQGKKPTVILGFNTASEVFCYDEFALTILTTTPAGRSRCSSLFTLPQKRPVSSALRNAWAVALVLVWAAAAKQNTATREFVRTVLSLKVRK